MDNKSAYIKTEWIDNQTIVDAKKLNKMEDALEIIKASTVSNASKIKKKIDSVLKEYNKLIFLSNGTRLFEIDLSSLVQVGAEGPMGPQGPKGNDGITPNIQIGEVTTLPSSQKATVARRGTDDNPIFDFGIPQGPQGNDGRDGRDGTNGRDGETVSVTIGSKKYTHVNGNITLPEYPSFDNTAESITIRDSSNLFTATNVEDALLELREELGNNKNTLENNINKIKEVL